MIYGFDKVSNNKCALDSKKLEAFTQKPFSDLIYDSHAHGLDYYIARIQCRGVDNLPYFYAYDARHLCKYIFEIVISAEGKKIAIKNFKDPIHGKDIIEINFFKMRYDSETPLKAEYAGNHMSFLESNVFRSKIFGQEEALDALSVNFKFKEKKKSRFVPKKNFLLFIIAMILTAALGIAVILGIKHGKIVLGRTTGAAVGKGEMVTIQAKANVENKAAAQGKKIPASNLKANPSPPIGASTGVAAETAASFKLKPGQYAFVKTH